MVRSDLRLVRPEGWETRLLEAIEQHEARPFVWGRDDCLTFALACARAMVPEIKLEKLPAYDDERSAARVLAKRKWRDVGDALASAFEEVHPAFAHRGDLGVIKGEEAAAAVVFVGPYVVGMDKPAGLRHVPRPLATRAFRVSL